ncbi:MAG: hypothetical protein ACXWCX_27815 [Burkholderiales bacterium]
MRNKFSDVNAAIVASASLPDAAPLEDWSNTADAFAADPSMDNFSAVKAASRKLAHAVRSVGVDITPDRLARAADSDFVPDRASTPENERVDAYIARRYPGR